MLLIRPQILRHAQLVSWRPPVANVVLIVTIERADIEDHGFARRRILGGVTIPTIAVD